MNETEFVDTVWQALLDKCACNPKEAKRLVMVSKDKVSDAMTSIFHKVKEKIRDEK